MQDARPRAALVSILVLAAATACDFEWGGAHLSLETPPSRDTAAAEVEPRADSLPPLPEGPLLYAVRPAPQGGGVSVTPIARFAEGRPAPLGWPSDPPATWRERFRESFLRPGLELPLYARGRRLGSVIMESVGEPVNAGCPSVARARLLLPPGAVLPSWSFARGDAAADPLPEAVAPGEPSQRMLTFGPILAERLLRSAGEERPYLARPAELSAVLLPGDTVPAMAATYLIGDTLAPVPPTASPSTSLFFLAGYREGSGYVSVWSVTESYSEPSRKVAFSHLDWLPEGGTARGVELLLRVSDSDVRLAAAEVDREEREGSVVWVEGEACPAAARLPRER